MSKKDSSPNRELNVTLPARLLDQLEDLIQDPVTKRPIYGKRRQIIVEGITRWIREEKQRRQQSYIEALRNEGTEE